MSSGAEFEASLLRIENIEKFVIGAVVNEKYVPPPRDCRAMLAVVGDETKKSEARPVVEVSELRTTI